MALWEQPHCLQIANNTVCGGISPEEEERETERAQNASLGSRASVCISDVWLCVILASLPPRPLEMGSLRVAVGGPCWGICRCLRVWVWGEARSRRAAAVQNRRTWAVPGTAPLLGWGSGCPQAVSARTKGEALYSYEHSIVGGRWGGKQLGPHAQPAISTLFCIGPVSSLPTLTQLSCHQQGAPPDFPG